MTDRAQGVDWWLASDGKWYPPTSTPGHAPTQVTVPAPTLSTTLAGWLQVTFWISAALSLIGCGLVFATLQRFNAWWDAPIGDDEVEYDAWRAG